MQPSTPAVKNLIRDLKAVQGRLEDLVTRNQLETSALEEIRFEIFKTIRLHLDPLIYP